MSTRRGFTGTYVFIQGEKRSALFLVIQDVFSRKVLGYRIGWSMRGSDVIELIDDVVLGLDKIPKRLSFVLIEGHSLYPTCSMNICKKLV